MDAKETKTKLKEKIPPKNSLLVILFSFVFALVLWFFVQEAEAPTYTKSFTDVQVQIQSLSSSFAVIDGESPTVTVTLKGKRSDLNKLKSADLEAYVDLSSVTKAGRYQFEIRVMSPEGTQVDELFPILAEMNIDQTVTVDIPVEVQLGQYTVGDAMTLEAIPALSEITVKGPKTVLDRVEKAQILTGDLGEVTAGFEGSFNYRLLDSEGKEVSSRYLVLPEASMRVNVSLYKTKTVPLTVTSKNGWWKKENIVCQITPKEVLIKGEPSVIDQTEFVSAVIYDETKVTDFNWTETIAPSELALPSGVSLGEAISPVEVSVSLQGLGRKNLQVNLRTNSKVIINEPEELDYTFENEVLRFEVRGAYGELSAATLEEFVFSVDLADLTEAGEYEVPVEIVQRVTSQDKFYVVGSYQVKVTLS